MRSELLVIVLQVFFAIVLIYLSYVFFSHLYDSVLETLLSEIIESLRSGSLTSGDRLTDTLQIVKANNFLLFATVLVTLTAIFTFLIAKITLKPAKDALIIQKRFISDIAHELRTPLAVIKTNSEVALMDDDLDKRMKDFLKSNVEELDRMSEIINNVLSFNNLFKSQKIKLDNVDLGPVIDNVVDKLGYLAKKRNIGITVKKTSPHIVWGNHVALGQVVTNLVKNAINYTPKGGHVTVTLEPDFYGNTLIYVEDTGIGINKKELMHVFEPFYRAESSRNRGSGSSGLGLTIASEIVKMHSGRLTLKSAVNKGTTAIVTLPQSKNVENGESLTLPGLSEISINFLKGKK